MIITEILARNARMYGNDVALVEREPTRNIRRIIPWKLRFPLGPPHDPRSGWEEEKVCMPRPGGLRNEDPAVPNFHFHLTAFLLGWAFSGMACFLLFLLIEGSPTR